MHADGYSCEGGPVEIIDIGDVPAEVGEMYSVKPLAAFAVMDPFRKLVSWKIVAMRLLDPRTDQEIDVDEFQERRPWELAQVREWLGDYGCPSGLCK